MWPCRNPGEDARLYKAVEAVRIRMRFGHQYPDRQGLLSMTAAIWQRQSTCSGHRYYFGSSPSEEYSKNRFS
jgi:hypothetical protein